MYLLITVHTMLLVSMWRTMPFSARALKKPMFLHWCCDKKWIEMWFIMVCNLIDKHPKHFLHIELVCKSFWKEVWHIQVSHLHNAAHAISSPSLCFQLSTNLDKDYFHYLWNCGKTTNRMWFSVVCTLIDNAIQVITVVKKLLWNCESASFWPLWWRVSLLIRVQTTLNNIWFVKLTKSNQLTL